MNKDVNVLCEDKDYIYISFEREPNCKYIIVGMNDIFNFETILSSDDNFVKLRKDIINKYLSIRVNYVIRDNVFKKDVLIGSSNSLVISNHNLERIDISWIDSYDGMTVSFVSKDIYDKYYLYEKVNDNYCLICETEDFQVTSSIFRKGNYYYVEAFKKANDGYKLVAASDKVKCESVSLSFLKKSLSIVVPIYNSEKFLCRCLDSVLLSTFNDFELILVDDGSSDKSSEIADWYHERYGDFIKVIHKENGGVSSARNVGITMADGEYIAFLDNDDFVHPFMYEKLYLKANEKNLDVVVGKTIIRNGIHDYKICLDIKNSDFVYDYEKMMREKNSNSSNNIFFVAIWNKIIKTEIVKKHLFPSDSFYEDTAFTNMIYSYASRFGFDDSSFYVWDKRMRKTIGTSTNSYAKKHDSLTLNQKYCDAIFYSVYYGNPLKINLLIYNAVREAILYTKKMGIFDKNSRVFDIYKNAIIKVHDKYNLKRNLYVQADKEIFEEVLKILG